MTKYVEKYPHPGPRPPDPGPDYGSPNVDDVDSVWMARQAYGERKRADLQWCAEMHLYLCAKALDAAFAGVPDLVLGDYSLACAGQWLAELGESWPREIFP